MEDNDLPIRANIQAVPDVQDQGRLISPPADWPPEARRRGVAKEPATPARRYSDMRKSIRTWGFWLMASALISLLPGFDMSWGVALLVVGLMSFYFFDAAEMFLVYAGAMLWAGLGNLLALESAWPIFGIVQIVWALLTYRQYRKYRGAKADYETEEPPPATNQTSLSRREARMPWLSAILGAVGLVGVCSLIPVSLVLYSLGSEDTNHPAFTVLAVLMQLGILAIPTGIAAVGSSYRPKAAAVAGIVFGALCVLLLIIAVIAAA